MGGSLLYRDSFVTSRDPFKVPAGAHVNMHVAVSAAITCICSMCIRHCLHWRVNRWAITYVMQDADLQDCVLLALLGVNETLDILSLGNVPV